MNVVLLSIALAHMKKCFFLNIFFLSTTIFQFLFHFKGQRRLLLFNDVLFAQEILEKLILLTMDYEGALRLENIEGKK